VNSPDLAWSEHKPDSLSHALQEDNGFWADDHWRMSACPLKPAQAVFRRDVIFHFNCQSPALNIEFKFAVMTCLKDGFWSAASDRALALRRTYLNVIFQFINTATPHCQSLAQYSSEYWETALRFYLKEHGIYRTKVSFRLDRHNQSRQCITEDYRILLLKYIYRLISNVYDARHEWEKDIVDLCKLGHSKPELLTSQRFNFTHLSQPWLRKPVKEYFRQRLVNTTVSSLQGMLSDLNCFSAFLSQYPLLRPCEIDRRLIEDYMGYISRGDLSSTTKSHRLVTLRGFLIWCHQRKIAGFPSELLIFDTDLPKRNKTLPRVIDPKVMDQFVQALPDLDIFWQRAIYILMYTGMRISDLLRLPLACLLAPDALGRYSIRFYIRKQKKEHQQPIERKHQEQVVAAIIAQQADVRKRWGEATSYLFPNPKGLPYLNNTFTDRINELIVKKGIHDELGRIVRITAHQFRHTFITELVKRGIPIPVVQRIVGHGSVWTTERYTYLTNDFVKAELEKYVDVEGKIYRPTGPANSHEMAYLHRHLSEQEVAYQTSTYGPISIGWCGLPAPVEACPSFHACLDGCPHFRTNDTKLPEALQLFEDFSAQLTIARQKGQARIIESLTNKLAHLKKMTLTLVELRKEKVSQGVAASLQIQVVKDEASLEEAIRKHRLFEEDQESV
jgi:site-specific recombinase XerD